MDSNDSSEALQSSQEKISTELNESLLSDDQPANPTPTVNPKFPIVYNNEIFMVDLQSLINASLAFKKLIEPYLNSKDQLVNLHLKVNDNKFTVRNMNNFFNLCQNLPADVQNSEMEEVCQIAKMFRADQLYNKGINFIHSSIDPNFNVSDNQYDGSDGKKYLVIEGPTQLIYHGDDTVPMRLSDDNESSSTFNGQANPEPIPTPATPAPNPTIKTPHSIIYTIIVEHPFLSLTQYKCHLDDKIIFSAKKQDDNVYIAEGSNIHINSNVKNHIAHIYLDTDKTNKIFLKDQQILLKFVNSGRPNHLSIQIDFKNNGKDVSWSPKPPKYDAVNDHYILNFHGEHHHTPLVSKKNIVLQNKKGNPTFIVRKMDTDHYEVECSALLDPLNAFTIGLSDIIGPYNDPCGDIEV